ncbi:hypothetical protein BDZ88DRAFT_432267 [Geranomyces variabilis]|nr:hypothetical protein BDZ88DRAFT_432267 [Geranomyces variabilis]KAJ3140004.1 hypothetical protein HDU90_008907 [Geranomyces variabilis]
MTKIKDSDKDIFHKFLQALAGALSGATEQDGQIGESERSRRKLPSGVQYTLYDQRKGCSMKANFYNTTGTIQLQPPSPEFMDTLLAWFQEYKETGTLPQSGRLPESVTASDMTGSQYFPRLQVWIFSHLSFPDRTAHNHPHPTTQQPSRSLSHSAGASHATATKMPNKAFVCGVSAYGGHYGLKNIPVLDATDIHNMLLSRGLPLENIELSINETADAFEARFQAFVSRLQPFDIVFFYFAGHAGTAKDDKQNILYLEGAFAQRRTKARAQRSSVVLMELMNRIQAVRVPAAVYIIDGCRTLSDVRAPSNDWTFNPIRSPRAYIMHATAENTTAANQHPSRPNGLFTGCLLEVWSGLVDPISIEELSKKVRRAVSKASDAHQNTWDSSSLDTTVSLP